MSNRFDSMTEQELNDEMARIREDFKRSKIKRSIIVDEVTEFLGHLVAMKALSFAIALERQIQFERRYFIDRHDIYVRDAVYEKNISHKGKNPFAEHRITSYKRS